MDEMSCYNYVDSGSAKACKTMKTAPNAWPDEALHDTEGGNLLVLHPNVEEEPGQNHCRIPNLGPDLRKSTRELSLER